MWCGSARAFGADRRRGNSLILRHCGSQPRELSNTYSYRYEEEGLGGDPAYPAIEAFSWPICVLVPSGAGFLGCRFLLVCWLGSGVSLWLLSFGRTAGLTGFFDAYSQGYDPELSEISCLDSADGFEHYR